MSEKQNHFDSRRGVSSSRRRRNRLCVNYPGFSFVAFLFFAFLYAPISIMVIFSFNSSKSISVWSGFSTKWYSVALANTDLHSAALNTLIVGMIATVMAILLALPAALATTGKSSRKEDAKYLALFAFPLMIPEIVIGIAMLIFFSSIGLKMGLGNVIIAHSVFCIPFAYLPITARLQSMDHSLPEAAYDLYASKWKCFWYVTLPLLLPGIISGAILSFIVSFDNFIITLMVTGAGGTTLPLYIYGLVKTIITPEVNAISALILSVSLLLLLIVFIVNRGKMMGVIEK